MIKLSKIFTREKGVWYAYVWDESDRLGFKKYLNHDVKHNLFLRKDEKLSVWYNTNETNEIHQKIRDKYLNDKNFVSMIFNDLNHEWQYISPNIENGQQIKNSDELHCYYTHLVNWWAAMAILFRLDLLSESAFEYRTKAEKFSDTMIEVWDEFWHKKEDNLREIMNLVTPEEAFSVNDLTQDKIDSIKTRQSGIALLNGLLYQLNQINAILKKNYLELEEIDNINNIVELTGHIAFKGKVSGSVKLILSSKDLSEIKQGEILVTEMTSPDYVLAIKKAAAIITDEGGITCHAAIVSREFGIPCLIGTKVATQVLKDGDLIEVDAINGVVKILKKAP